MFPRTPSRRLADRFRPGFEILEDRCVPTTNLILAFNGGTLAPNPNYLLPLENLPGAATPYAGYNFAPYAALTNPDGSTGNRTEQILQIVAGVREDFAPFDVNVIWDDRGVNSPYYRQTAAGFNDVVQYVVNTPNTAIEGQPNPDDEQGDFGLASSVDNQETQKITFSGTITGGTFTLTFNGETTDPIVYQADPSALALSMQNALRALPDVSMNDPNNTNVDVESASAPGQSGVFAITFANALGNSKQTVVQATSNLTGVGTGITTAEVFVGGKASRRDVAFTFEPANVSQDVQPMVPWRQLRELISTISHEFGHTLGVSHSAAGDSQMRQIVAGGATFDNGTLDSRFSQQVLARTGPETGAMYSEYSRLADPNFLGLAKQTFTDTVTSQSLPHQNAPVDADATAALFPLSSANAGNLSGNIDFFGDRDAFQFTVSQSGTFTVQELASAGSSIAPVLTLWDANGNFIAVGTTGASGGTSTLAASLTAGQVYYVIAGTSADRFTSDQLASAGALPSGPTGGYTLQIGLTVVESQQVVSVNGSSLTLSDGTVIPVVKPVPVSPLTALAVVPQVFTPGAPNARTAYITGLYRTVLQRDPDPAGLNSWLQAMAGGVPNAVIAQSFWESTEHRIIQVNFYYEEFLGRAPSAADQLIWVNAFLHGFNEGTVTLGFLTSPEYQALHPSDTSFVTSLYQNVLDRAPDAAGLANWLSVLAQGRSRALVVQAFENSAESLTDVVEGFYLSILHRTASASEVQPALAALQRFGGASYLEQAAISYLTSGEFLGQAAASVR